MFYNEHLDLWSMGDSFDRFLRPRKHVRFFEHESCQLHAIARDRLRLRAVARDDEERLLRDVLDHAKRMYQGGSGCYLFLLRRVRGTSSGSPVF